jgi:hypothetical protein
MNGELQHTGWVKINEDTILGKMNENGTISRQSYTFLAVFIFQ